MTSTEKVDKLNKQIVNDIFRAVNYSNNGRRLAKVFIEHIETEHRTLVQSFFKMMVNIIDGYAQHEEFDDRNKGSLEWAKKVAFIDYYMPLI